MTISLNKNNFKTFLELNPTCLVEFYSPTCAPCKMISPILDELSEIPIGKIDGSSEQELVAAYGIRSVPVLIKFVDSIESKRLSDATMFNKREKIVDFFNS